MKITITGASGFIGLNLQDYLKEENKIDSLSMRYVPTQKFILNGDAIIHLAGKAHDLKKVSLPQDYYDANFELTKQLFDSFLQSQATVFIFMSTVKAVADAVEGILDEEFKPNPITAYGKSKLMAEEYILQNLPQNKKVYILRPCMIHGPGNKGNLNLLHRFVSKGIPYPFGVYENERSFLSVDNLSFIIKELIDKNNIPSGIYNVADDEFISTNEVVRLIATVAGKRPNLLAVPKVIINAVARLGDLIKTPFNIESVKKLTENYRVSNKKIKHALNIEILPVTVRHGLKITIQSFFK